MWVCICAGCLSVFLESTTVEPRVPPNPSPLFPTPTGVWFGLMAFVCLQLRHLHVSSEQLEGRLMKVFVGFDLRGKHHATLFCFNTGERKLATYRRWAVSKSQSSTSSPGRYSFCDCTLTDRGCLRCLRRGRVGAGCGGGPHRHAGVRAMAAGEGGGDAVPQRGLPQVRLRALDIPVNT